MRTKVQSARDNAGVSCRMRPICGMLCRPATMVNRPPGCGLFRLTAKKLGRGLPLKMRLRTR